MFMPMGRGRGWGVNSSTRLPQDLGASMEAPAGAGGSGEGFGASGEASGSGPGGLAPGMDRRGLVAKVRRHWQRRHVMGRLGRVRRASAALLLGTAMGLKGQLRNGRSGPGLAGVLVGVVSLL